MKATELLDLLREVYREKLAMRQRHVAAARLVAATTTSTTRTSTSSAREEMQLNWLRDAIVDER